MKVAKSELFSKVQLKKLEESDLQLHPSYTLLGIEYVISEIDAFFGPTRELDNTTVQDLLLRNGVGISHALSHAENWLFCLRWRGIEESKGFQLVSELHSILFGKTAELQESQIKLAFPKQLAIDSLGIKDYGGVYNLKDKLGIDVNVTWRELILLEYYLRLRKLPKKNAYQIIAQKYGIDPRKLQKSFADLETSNWQPVQGNLISIKAYVAALEKIKRILQSIIQYKTEESRQIFQELLSDLEKLRDDLP